MRILLLKTSSLGDLVHMLPALSDAAKRIPGLRVDWVAEESFAAVPAWHPVVTRLFRSPCAAGEKISLNH